MRKITAGVITAWMRFKYGASNLIVLVDDDGTPIGTAPKLEAHNADTRLHLAFSVFLFNHRGELLLQQRALTKKTWPGVWSNSCCGHVMMHESTDAAAKRRLEYELGLSGVDLTMALPDFRYRAEKDGIVENEICPVLIGFTNSKPVPNPSEVADVRWIDWQQFLISIDKPENEMSPWAMEEVRLLAGSEVFENWFTSHVSVSGTPSSM